MNTERTTANQVSGPASPRDKHTERLAVTVIFLSLRFLGVCLPDSFRSFFPALVDIKYQISISISIIFPFSSLSSTLFFSFFVFSLYLENLPFNYFFSLFFVYFLPPQSSSAGGEEMERSGSRDVRARGRGRDKGESWPAGMLC